MASLLQIAIPLGQFWRTERERGSRGCQLPDEGVGVSPTESSLPPPSAHERTGQAMSQPLGRRG